MFMGMMLGLGLIGVIRIVMMGVIVDWIFWWNEWLRVRVMIGDYVH
jgi:hypothetical protein